MERATADQDRDLVDLVDEAGRVIGQAARATVHHGNTPRHRAFSVYLTDDAGRVLPDQEGPEQDHLAGRVVKLMLRPSATGRVRCGGYSPSCL